MSSQIQMYQLSRLLHDYHRELYNHLEDHEISPSLYAAPWFLTLFASQFPLGFVSRVFGTNVFFLDKHTHVVQTILFPHDSQTIFSCVHVASLSDFVFIQGTGVIFKVALCLLSSHEGEIMECDSFESIVDYLKSTLPALSQTQMEQTIAKV